MTWESLAVRVYGYGRAATSDIQNIRRAAEQMHDVEMLRYDSKRHAGPRLYGTPEENWLRGYIIDVYPDTMKGVDYAGYRPPQPEHVLEAFRKGCHQERRIRVNLGRVVKLVNKCCKTTFDPSEVVWWRVGLEEQREQLRKSEMNKLHSALSAALTDKERQELEARLVTFGPYRVDPEQAAQCPCCHQQLPNGLPLKLQPAPQPGLVAKPRQSGSQTLGALA